VDKLWLKHYQKGVPTEIDPNDYASLTHLFLKSCHQYKDSIAYSHMGFEMSYGELEKQSLYFASYLQQLGLQKGARVAIMLPNVIQFPIVLFAILQAGYIVVNTNPLYTSDELTHQLLDCGAEAIIVLANFASTIEKSMPKLPLIKHVIITQIGDVFPTFKRLITNAVVKYVKKMVPPYHIPHAIDFRKALRVGAFMPFKPVELSHEDIAFLQYTGGTTGGAKGAMLTHRNIIANVLQASAWIAPLSLSSQDIIITALPLYHIFSLTANCLTFFNVGAKSILITNPRDMGRFIKAIKHSQFTAITGVNTLFNALLKCPQFKKVDFSKLKLALSGGMALQKSVALKWQEVTHSPILEAYGLTETSPAVTVNPLNLRSYNGSIGLPISSTDISIRDDSGKEVPIGESGELCVKGPQVMAGYWHQNDETALVFWKDGFFRTGDIAKMNDDGFVFLVDRKKDMILISGFNVYPNEVEQVISMLPGVHEVGVIGVVDENSVEQVKACIVKSDPSLTKEQVIAYTREHLTPYKVPKIIEFYDELPKTNIGKILRRALR